MYKAEFPALGTTWWIKIFDDSDKPDQIIESARSLVLDFEQNYSRFRQDSLVGRLNAGETLTSYPDELREMLEFAQQIYHLSVGYFDIRIGSTLENIGYDAAYSFQAKQPVSVSSEDLAVTSELKLPSGVKIDFGGMGKGWLIDKVAKYFSEQGLKYFSINAGGDIYVSSDHDRPVSFGLEHPFDLGKIIGNIDLKNTAIASSAPNRRQWKSSDGRSCSHLVSPKSSPSQQRQVSAVFVHSPTALLADTCATAIFVSNPKVAKSLATNLGVEFMLVFNDLGTFSTKAFPGKLI